ncbi:FecR family protein [Sphingobacterium yanglingense]|uniref:FecR family protein n=1 Tax=Sphingobacterium yanglingense TaxID=1437280 RepID=A0A4R6WG54_9SPHI|nr:FecR family protein [Sphingobacterium yanglingense]TDQ79130.1 FecR family protein [Sphingobacterium yanglingense]
MIPEEVQKLIAKYKAGDISENELSELYSWYNQRAREPIMIDDVEMQIRLERIGRQLPNTGGRKVSFYSWYKWAAAAVAVVAIGISIYRYQTEAQPVESNLTIVADTTASAQFITADNKSISINSIAVGDTVVSDGLLLYKTNDGYVAYEYQEGKSETNLMHTVRTPIGTESKILLPDGTRVWLNAASELTFAKQLGRSNRTVFLKGEAYFDVTKQMIEGEGYATFQVHSDQQMVEVLGTKFRIKNYLDEAVASTSLYEGSVKLQTMDAANRLDKSVLLKPGQQGLFDRTKNILDFKNISEGEPQTWRDGYFSFHGATLEEVCQQLARWYSVRFEIEEGLPNGEYHGDIPKVYSLNEVLSILIQDKMKYRLYNKDNQMVVKLTQ